MTSFAKDAVAIVLDVGRGMANAAGGGLDIAKKAVRLFIQQKLLKPGQDEIALILMGTKETDNALADDNNYKHITVLRPLSPPDLDILEMIDSIEGEHAEADLTDVLLVAMALLEEGIGKKKYNRRLFLITDAAAKIRPDNLDQVDEIIRGMVQQNVRLNVIGIGLKDEEEDQKAEDSKMSDTPDLRTPIQRENQELLRRIANETTGVLETGTNALKIMGALRPRAVKQVTKMRGPLVLSDACSISVYSYTKTDVADMPSLKKRSRPADDDQGADVKMDRTYWNKMDEDMARERKPEERVQAYMYGKSPITGWDSDALKFGDPVKGLRVIGFVKASTVPHHYFMDGVDCIVAEPGMPADAVALSALIHALYEMDRVILARYVKRANAAPILAALHPHISADNECLYLNHMPFSEDVREFSFASFNKHIQFQPNSAQLAAAKNLISAMDLDHLVDDGGEEYSGFEPEDTVNPVLQRFYQILEARAQDPTAPIAPLDPQIAKYVIPPERMVDQARHALAAFKHAFPVQKVEEKARQRRHWRDEPAASNQVAAADSDMRHAKRSRTDGDEKKDSFGFEDIVTSGATEVSRTDPIKSFEAMLQRRDDPDVVTRAIDQMWGIIKDFIAMPNKEWHARAVDCLVALRKGCVVHEEPIKFNTIIADIKTARKPDVWKLIENREVRPIDSSECAESDFTPERARAYLSDSGSSVGALEMSKPQDDQDDQDIFGQLL